MFFLPDFICPRLVLLSRIHFTSSAESLRLGESYVQRAGARSWRVRTECVQVVGNIWERELDLITAARRRRDFVEHAVAAGNQDCPSIHRHRGVNWGRIVQEGDSADDGADEKIVDEDRRTARVDDVQLRAVRGREEVHRLQSALA
jgi:hypothetical protein